MRVLHFFKTYWPDTFGGIERTIDAIARSTSGLGVETTVLSLSRKPREHSVEFHGHRAVKARLDLDIASTGLSLGALGQFAREAAEADIVHYHFPWPYMDAAHFLVRHGKPSVVTYHSDIIKQRALKQVYAPLMQCFLGSVDAVVATSPNYAASSPVLARYRDRLEIIPIGLEDEVDAEETMAPSLATDRPFFLFAGVLRYYKGLDVLLDAASLVPGDIVILGSGPLEDHLRRRAQAERLTNVRFVGALPDEEKVALMRRCCAFVFPSNERSEAFGLSLVEAAMFARPMISTEISTGTSYVNFDGETGLVVPPNDAQALAAAMNEILRAEERAVRWGATARRRYLDLFTAEAMGRRYCALYTRLLTQGRG
ncbi:glycosyltransferase [Aurantimonas coralicida]|uniref:glycosyltransferase n=1 Tax=Aurantimonas coralicida TaxID=182270 RepID=UPI001D190877|nr:glycosyltransferase [Aurantimonas coralicida]MCC4300021.1 glycosyltransferase [Aurantimonas coralicida]